jgi:hypothetical protein
VCLGWGPADEHTQIDSAQCVKYLGWYLEKVFYFSSLKGESTKAQLKPDVFRSRAKVDDHAVTNPRLDKLLVFQGADYDPSIAFDFLIEGTWAVVCAVPLQTTRFLTVSYERPASEMQI